MSQVVIGDILPYTQATATLNQTVFGTNWTANYASDVVVYQTPAGDPPDDVTQILPYPAGYSVAFIGGLQQVQVTLVTPTGAGDIITISRQTPADRMNLYTNTNFTPTMLNNDFGILTLVDQQAQLVNQLIGPRYNYSAIITDVVDTILPILEANQVWVKNSSNTAIIGLDVPASGFAPADGTYVLLTPNAALPDAQALSTFGASGILAFNNGTQMVVETSIIGTSNEITVINGLGVGTIGLAIASNPIIPGSAGMGIPIGTTGQRVIPGSNISLRYNTTDGSLEYWNGSAWIQLIDDVVVQPGLINELAWYAASGQSVSGLATIDNGVLTTSSSGVPTWLANGTAGYVLTANSGAPPTYQSVSASGAVTTIDADSGSASPAAGVITISGGSTGLTTSASGSTVTLVGLLASTFGGTGVDAPTAHGVMIAEGASAMVSVVLGAGQILIGTTASDPVAGAINSGTSVLVQNASGSITVGLAAIASHDILSNITSGSAAPIANTLTATIDAALGSTQGDILYRNSTVWTVLAPGTSGQFLQTQGAAADVQWASGNSGTVTSIATNNGVTGGTITTTGTIGLASIADHTLLANISGGSTFPSSTTLTALIDNAIGSTQGDILYRNATSWVVLAPGTSGFLLSSGGAAANPSWIAPAASSVTFTGDSGTPFSGNAVTVTGGSTGLTFAAATPDLTLAGTLAIANGGTAKTSVTVAPAATSWAGWDANKNLSANSLISGYATTATAASTTTLTVGSAQQQFFTGTTTQTVLLPVTSTLVLGQSFFIVNNSTGVVTVQSSGGNTVYAMPASTQTEFTCILTSGTTAASWNYEAPIAGSGTVNSGTSGQLAYYASTTNAVSGTNAGTGVITALGVNVGSAGAFVVNGGALGTPSSGSVINCTGAVEQVVSAITGAVATGTTTVPYDDTIPQNTEGDQYMSLAITPKNTANTLVITALAFVSSSAVNQNLIMSLFQDSTANALATMVGPTSAATQQVPIPLTWVMAAGTISSTTFKIRIGGNQVGTTTFNGSAGSRYFGGVIASSIVITEYAA